MLRIAGGFKFQFYLVLLIQTNKGRPIKTDADFNST